VHGRAELAFDGQQRGQLGVSNSGDVLEVVGLFASHRSNVDGRWRRLTLFREETVDRERRDAVGGKKPAWRWSGCSRYLRHGS